MRLKNVLVHSMLGSLLAMAAFGEEGKKLKADLQPIQEVPAVSSTADGEVSGTLSKDNDSIAITVKYENLEAPLTMSHIHIAQKGVNGGVMLWLCGTQALPGPVGTPVCPTATSGTYSRTLTVSDLVPVPAQGIDAGQFREAVNAIRSGVAYVNLHTTRFPGGELRGQIKTASSNNDKD